MARDDDDQVSAAPRRRAHSDRPPIPTTHARRRRPRATWSDAAPVRHHVVHRRPYGPSLGNARRDTSGRRHGPAPRSLPPPPPLVLLPPVRGRLAGGRTQYLFELVLLDHLRASGNPVVNELAAQGERHEQDLALRARVRHSKGPRDGVQQLPQRLLVGGKRCAPSPPHRGVSALIR